MRDVPRPGPVCGAIELQQPKRGYLVQIDVTLTGKFALMLRGMFYITNENSRENEYELDCILTIPDRPTYEIKYEPSLVLVNSLRPSDAYRRQWITHHWFRQWLVAWSAPSHYLNQYWNIVNSNLWNKLQWNLKRNSCIFIQENAFESVVCETAAILSRPQCVNAPDLVMHGIQS